MNRLDFSSVMAVIRYYISPDHGLNQGELLDELFYSLHAESKEPIIFDGASVNRWLKGTERVSPVISRYYLKKRNIHANLGGMYRESGSYIKAKVHMESSITLLQQYDLLACHDSIPQVVNYATLLSEMGQPDKAIAVLEQVEKVVQAHNSAVCMDTAAIHEAMGNTYLMTGNMEQAAIQHYT